MGPSYVAVGMVQGWNQVPLAHSNEAKDRNIILYSNQFDHILDVKKEDSGRSLPAWQGGQGLSHTRLETSRHRVLPSRYGTADRRTPW